MEDNLCLSCAWCNSFKGVKTEAEDPQSGRITRLFNPRLDEWNDHFVWDQASIQIMGLTAIGRVTVSTLRMNNEYILPARRHWVEAGWHPPK